MARRAEYGWCAVNHKLQYEYVACVETKLKNYLQQIPVEDKNNIDIRQVIVSTFP